MVRPPVTVGTVKETDAEPLLGVADTPVGAPGTVEGETELLAEEADPEPSALAAVAVKVYESPLVRPETVIGDEVPVPVWPPLPELVVSVAVTV